MMKCPYCGETATKVTESRRVPYGNALRRHHECPMCMKGWATYEIMKKDFDRLTKIERLVIKMLASFKKELKK